MEKAIELADSTFRAYKKRNGSIALHLRTHLVVYADAAFRAKLRETWPKFPMNLDEPRKHLGLSAFLKESPRCWLRLAGKKQCECKPLYGLFPQRRSVERAVENGATCVLEDIADEECALFFFWAKMIISDGNIEELSIADMKLMFCINFPDRTPNEKIIIRRKVPVVRRGRGW